MSLTALVTGNNGDYVVKTLEEIGIKVITLLEDKMIKAEPTEKMIKYLKELTPSDFQLIVVCHNGGHGLNYAQYIPDAFVSKTLVVSNGTPSSDAMFKYESYNISHFSTRIKNDIRKELTKMNYTLQVQGKTLPRD